MFWTSCGAISVETSDVLRSSCSPSGLNRDDFGRHTNLHIDVHRGHLRDCRDEVVDDRILQARRADRYFVGSGDDLGRDKGAGGVGLPVEDRHAGVLVENDDLGVWNQSTGGVQYLAANGRVGVLRIRHTRARDDGK